MVDCVTLFAEFHPHSLSHTQSSAKESLHPQAYAGGIFATIKKGQLSFDNWPFFVEELKLFTSL